MKFKHYAREYEYVFTNDRLLKKCNPEKVSVYRNTPSELDGYIVTLRKTILDFQKEIFNYIVKIVWLFRRFQYDGKRRVRSSRNGIYVDGAFSVFMKHYVGVDHRFLLTKNIPYTRIISYLDDFFPAFDDGNPFVDNYEYPYKNITLEYLGIVFHVFERLELLKYCDKQKMSYDEFLDYVINFINCYNDENGKTYEFMFNSTAMPYIKNIKRKKYER